jgi:cysteine-S-conjugate beta-lyase
MKEHTLQVHSGNGRDPHTGASSTPIYQASTFHQANPLQLSEYDYTRSNNPTRQSLEKAIAQLEGGTSGFAFASGMAAITSTFLIFKPGDHIVVCQDVYGGTYRILSGLLARWGLQSSFVDATDPLQVQGAIQPNTVAIYAETPSNPLLKITPLEQVANIAKKHKLLSIIDNTFMSPYLQKPIALGFDIVLHSATKFLGGHSDVLAGLAVAANDKVGALLKHTQNAIGAVLGPQDSWLIQRGMRTLAVRMEQQQKNAQTLAEWLHAHPAVQQVFYPGLPQHPGHAIHMQQSKGGGAVLSFTLAHEAAALQLMHSVTIPLVAVSLGGVESILSYPTTMSHAAMPATERLARGIHPGLLRLSVGLEDVEDLMEDLQNGLNQ